MQSKKQLTERDICTKYITPAIQEAKWNLKTQMREEVYFTDGRIIVQGKLYARGKGKRADYILYYKPNIPIAIVEAKKNTEPVGAGMQQALEYADILDIPFVFTSNGDSFVFHDKTLIEGTIEREIGLEEFPSPGELWQKYLDFKDIESADQKFIIEQEYPQDDGKTPRYYQ